MEGRRGALELSEEIELCGKLRNDIGKALKTDAHNAAKAQSESEESKALETLIENEALNLEESIAAAETSFLYATASIERIEVATAHLHGTNSVLSQQLDKAFQQIDESTEAFEELRKRHVSFCQAQEEAHKRMTSVEALLRSIMNGEEQTRGLMAELQALRSALDVLGRTKGELVPVLESCQEAFDSAKREYEQSKKNNAHHLESIERCREEEEQMKTKMAQLRDEHTQLSARKATLEAQVARVQSAVTAEVQIAAQEQREAVEKHEKCSRLLDARELAMQDRERALSMLKEEMQKATEEMYSTIERMKELRKHDAELAHRKQKVVEMLKNEQAFFAKLKEREICVVEFRAAQQKTSSVTESLHRENKKTVGLRGMLEMTRMERTEMAALRENEGTILSESLEVLQKAEKEADEATGAGEELKGLIEAVEAILTEQKKITHTLVLSRSRVDLQLKNGDIAESRLRELRCLQAALAAQVNEREIERRQHEAFIEQLQEEMSTQKLELRSLEQEHSEIQTNLEGLKAKYAKDQGAENAEGIESQTELFRIREQLQAKHETACAQVRVEYQCQYTAMLNQTLKDEEGRLTEEKRSKMEQIAALVERTTGEAA